MIYEWTLFTLGIALSITRLFHAIAVWMTRLYRAIALSVTR
ncbi:MAG: hypothetical protein ACR2LR_18630 [Hassallia sp.]